MPRGDKADSAAQQIVRMISDGAVASETRMRKEMRRLRSLTRREFRRGDEGLRWGSPYETENAEPDIRHRWVITTFEGADTPIDVVHNMNIPLRADGGVALRYEVLGMAHNGTGANASSTLSVNYETTDVGLVTENSFPLRLYVGGTRTVNASNPVVVTFVVVPI